MKPEKLLLRMRRSKSGWGQDDLQALYLGFGFIEFEGGKHRRYTHPKYPFLQATVGRHNSLAKGYIETALELIDRLQMLEAEEKSDD